MTLVSQLLWFSAFANLLFPSNNFSKAVIFCDSILAITAAQVSKISEISSMLVTILRQCDALHWVRGHTLGGTMTVDQLVKNYAAGISNASRDFNVSLVDAHTTVNKEWPYGYLWSNSLISFFLSFFLATSSLRHFINFFASSLAAISSFYMLLIIHPYAVFLTPKHPSLVLSSAPVQLLSISFCLSFSFLLFMCPFLMSAVRTLH